MASDKNTENMIEFITGEHYATLSFTEPAKIRRMKKLREENPDEFKYLVENPDGSICCKVPKKWIKISPTRKVNRVYTDEERKAFAEKMAQYRNKPATE